MKRPTLSLALLPILLAYTYYLYFRAPKTATTMSLSSKLSISDVSLKGEKVRSMVIYRTRLTFRSSSVSTSTSRA